MKKTVSLTSTHIDSLRDGALFDREVPGLAIIVSAGGRKRWRFKRSVAGGKAIVELKLGAFPDFSIADAREWARPLSAWGQRLAQTNYPWLFPSPRVEGPQKAGWFKAREIYLEVGFKF